MRADADLAGIEFGADAADRTKCNVLPLPTQEDAGRYRPIHTNAASNAANEFAVHCVGFRCGERAIGCTRPRVGTLSEHSCGCREVKSAQRKANGGIWQKLADRVTRACTQQSVIDQF